jgi:hypothetical protein
MTRFQDGWLFLSWRLFHSQLHAGLSRRYLPVYVHHGAIVVDDLHADAPTIARSILEMASRCIYADQVVKRVYAL